MLLNTSFLESLNSALLLRKNANSRKVSVLHASFQHARPCNTFAKEESNKKRKRKELGVVAIKSFYLRPFARSTTLPGRCTGSTTFSAVAERHGATSSLGASYFMTLHETWAEKLRNCDEIYLNFPFFVFNDGYTHE